MLRHPVDHVGQLAPGAAVTAQHLRRLEPLAPGDVEVPPPARHQDSCSNMEDGELVLGFSVLTYILRVRRRNIGSTEENIGSTQET